MQQKDKPYNTPARIVRMEVTQRDEVTYVDVFQIPGEKHLFQGYVRRISAEPDRNVKSEFAFLSTAPDDLPRFLHSLADELPLGAKKPAGSVRIAGVEPKGKQRM